ncbi:MAG TPA: hypothetical protein VFZ65_08905 [Planctomycetota bacterium]|nr:hypothetical protein [Planctomycetota bacterium]
MNHCSLLLLTIATSTGLASAQNLLLPDNHHLVESSTQTYLTGTTSFWGSSTATPSHFQVLYHADHFTGQAGVSGPIVLQHLRFRGTDTWKNTGGQTYSGVTVSVYKTSHTESTMSLTFADNLPPGVGGTTTLLGTFTYPTLTVGPSAGTAPNNWNLDLDLTSSPLLFDPAGDALGEVNLLIDASYATLTLGPPIAPATVGVALCPFQDTTAHGAGIRGKGVRASSLTAATGTAANPLVIGVEFAGAGGFTQLQPARTESIGLACGGAPSSFYEVFAHGQSFDMGNGGGLTLTPDNPVAPTAYVVSYGAPPADLTMVNALPNTFASGSAEDGVVDYPMGFTFQFPGGSTSVIRPSTNGFIWLNGTQTDNDFSPTVLELLGNTVAAPKPARLAVLWHDFSGSKNNVPPTITGNGLHAVTDTSGGPGNSVVYVTWLNTGEFPITGYGQSVNTFQCVLHEATGVVEYRYGAMTELSGSTFSGTTVNAVVGFSRGQIGGVNSIDPQSIDLSHEAIVPFTTFVEGSAANVRLTSASTPVAEGPVYGARAFAGQSLTWNVANIPAGTLFALVNLDVAGSQPGIQVPGLTAPGCRISTTLSPLILAYELWVLPSTSVTGTNALVIPQQMLGFDIYAQAIGLDFTGPYLVPWASNGLRHTLGLD